MVIEYIQRRELLSHWALLFPSSLLQGREQTQVLVHVSLYC